VELIPAYVVEFCFPYDANTVKAANDAILIVLKSMEGKDDIIFMAMV